MPRLENWLVYQNQWPSGLIGEARDDTRFHDGKVILTSPVVYFNWSKRLAITESGTEYELGEPSHDYTRYLELIESSLPKLDFDNREKQ